MSELVAGGMYDGPGGAVWQQGDFNYDGLVDSLDIGEFIAAGLYDGGNYLAESATESAAFATAPAASTLTATDVAFLAFAIEQDATTTKTTGGLPTIT